MPSNGSCSNAWARSTPPADVVLVDTSLGHPLAFSPLGLAAPETVIVVAPNGAAITEAYALIKKVSLGYARKHFRILVSQVRPPARRGRYTTTWPG
jgi:MinD-like ATPase involved in chromosome partitioning or flagellar assembly